MLNLKLAFRTLFKTPFVTTVAVLSLALGIGANAAIFSLFDQMLLRTLPVQEPGRLVNLANPGPKPGSNTCNNAGDCDTVFSYWMFRDLERVQTVFTGIAAHRLFDVNLSFGGQTLSGDGVLVSGGYFPVLGIQPALGRLLGPSDDRVIGESRVVVLSHAILAQSLRRSCRCAESVAHRQRTDDDHRGGRASGFRRYHARVEAAGVRADYHARADVVGIE